MKTLEFLRRCRMLFRYQNFCKIQFSKRTQDTLIKNVAFSSFLFGGSTILVKKTPKSIKEKKPPNYINQIKDDCIGSEKKINNLIKTLQGAITETCEKYRICLQKQVDILETGKHVDPLDQYWDILVPLRVEANTLKKDFESYRSMVDYVGQLAFNLAFCSAMMCNLDSKDYVCSEYFELEKLAKEQLSENKKFEEVLLKKNMQNILNTSNTAKNLKDIAEELKKNIENSPETP